LNKEKIQKKRKEKRKGFAELSELKPTTFISKRTCKEFNNRGKELGQANLKRL